MRRIKAAVAMISAAAFLGGCAGSTSTMTIDVDQPVALAASDFTLGAGDSLGWRVYQKDVFLAMRDGYSRGIYQPTLFPDTRVVEVPVD